MFFKFPQHFGINKSVIITRIEEQSTVTSTAYSYKLNIEGHDLPWKSMPLNL